MKKDFYALSFLMLMAMCVRAQVIWEEHPSGYSEPVTVFDVEVVDENTVWTSSYKGDFSGDAWVMIPSNLLTKTTDGGQTWQEITVPVPDENWGVSHMFALDGTTAWLAMHNAANFTGDLYRTTDGGATWEDMDAITNFGDFVHFWDDMKGIVVGDSKDGYFEIYTTMNGGDTWERVPQANVPVSTPDWEYGNFGTFAAFGSHIWFGSSSGRIFHSADYGQNWTVATTAIGVNSYPLVEGISMQNEMHGIAYVADYSSSPYQATIVRTFDGGVTWLPMTLADNDYSIFEAKYIPGSPYLIKTSRGSNGAGPYLTSISMDDGENWMEIDEYNTPIMRIEFLSPTYGWGGKFKNDNSEAKMYRYVGSPLSGILSRKPLDAQVTVSPNPTTGPFRVEVKVPSASDFWILVNDANGKLVERKEINQATLINQQFDLSGYATGTYFITVSNPHGSQTVQVLKQ
ncbi:MAG: T9SS type A sorting domain-containing protein [Saprospiraceae bacterium]|nr:T9SS type A sorting domain-containing protein [Saprospiraceae bacterium]